MRIRITFAKQGALRYTGHLDLHKIWERTARRASLPLSYSQGFHPHPHIQLAAALPLGFSSRCEVVDMKLKNKVDLIHLPEQIQNAVPSGLRILNIQEVDDLSPALQTLVTSSEYEVTLLSVSDLATLSRNLDSILGVESIQREWRGKLYDLRPLIEELRVMEPDEMGNPRLLMRLSARQGATGRPEEVLDVIGIPFEDTRVERSKLIFDG